MARIGVVAGIYGQPLIAGKGWPPVHGGWLILAHMIQGCWFLPSSSWRGFEIDLMRAYFHQGSWQCFNFGFKIETLKRIFPKVLGNNNNFMNIIISWTQLQILIGLWVSGMGVDDWAGWRLGISKYCGAWCCQLWWFMHTCIYAHIHWLPQCNCGNYFKRECLAVILIQS